MLSNNEIPVVFHQTQSVATEAGTLTEKSPFSKKTSSNEKKRQSMPIMRSPEKKKVILTDTTPISGKGDSSADCSSEQFVSPTKIPVLKLRTAVSPTESGDSPRIVKSPRSPHSEHETMSSRRHRIDSPTSHRALSKNSVSSSSSSGTVTQTVTSTSDYDDEFGNTKPASIGRGTLFSTSQSKSPQQTPSHRLSAPINTVHLNEPTSEQLSALADLWMGSVLGLATDADGVSHYKKLTASKIPSLGRTDGWVPIASLPDPLLSLLFSAHVKDKIQLSFLLRLLLANQLGQSQAGKTIFAMQNLVVHAHPKLAEIDVKQLTSVDEVESHAIKKRMTEAVKSQAEACVDVILGAGRKLEQSRLPLVLLQLWRQLDAKLIIEATKNPELSAQQILTALENLGFDLIITRQIFPYAMKPVKPTSAAMGNAADIRDAKAAPSVLDTTFASTLCDILRKEWPVFCQDAFRHFDA